MLNIFRARQRRVKRAEKVWRERAPRTPEPANQPHPSGMNRALRRAYCLNPSQLATETKDAIFNYLDKVNKKKSWLLST